MLSDKTLNAYRKMTPGERLALTFQAMRESLPYLLAGTPDVVDRRFARIRDENDKRNRAMLEGLARARQAHEGN